MKPGDVVWGPAGGHPAVVIKGPVGGRVLLMSGTGNRERDCGERQEVKGGTRIALRMGLSKTTYFYERESLHDAAEGELTGRGRTCPGELFDWLIDRARAEAPAAVRRDWWDE